MNASPIGVFDSGLGGLTAVKELRKILPGEDIVYFGDTGRVPYGSRGKETIVHYAKQDIAFLLSKGVKSILIACGTVSSTLPPAVMQGLPVPCAGVVGATVAAAAAATQNGKVGVIGTEATIRSGSYEAAMKQLAPNVTCFAAACPLFVPLVENGHFLKGDRVAIPVAEEYLAPIKAAGVDTLIMGCTHYPLLADVIAEEMGSGVTLVDAGLQAAQQTKQSLANLGLLNGRQTGGQVAYYVSDVPARFNQLAQTFLGEYAGGAIEQINIEDYNL
ncbi:glutamate racemase [Ruminococcaceae bacterium OttesenSCG-928-A16]|nr:glutamate racemase [Ruminococcaceae bacterium OttesenSCG-928-A16]